MSWRIDDIDLEIVPINRGLFGGNGDALAHAPGRRLSMMSS